MSAFSKRFKVEVTSGVALSFWACLILFVAVTGPFGTYAAFGFVQRLLTFTPIMLATLTLAAVIRTLVFSILRPWSFRWACTLNAVVAALIIAPILDQFMRYISDNNAVTVPDMGELLLLVFSLSLGMSSLRRAVAPQSYWESFPPGALPQPTAAPTPEPEALLEAEPEAEPEVPRHPRLLQRIEAYARGDLLAVSVRNHYVDVQTSNGVAGLLMRLSDAIAETDPVEGAQIHRSHWVAWDAVRAAERDGSKVFVTLSNGTRLPVSKVHQQKLVERGLL
ncbi:LytTR family DNA-binding domain-containing protein [Cypionkella sp.]|uniref:LytTR family DNA-binding domain-containing protein n=1 Tax=Cypionkella sp. TaxID=2811411 RepID=UPI0026096345|nr:LytTR family DNA-binding domain-containing protein [Cypionkella sp.]MDB5664263.1 response regulator receiver protein [Cypionkella sp.]